MPLSEVLEIEFPRDTRHMDLLERLASKLSNEWIGKDNFTTNAAVRAVRWTVGFTQFLNLILDHEDELLSIMPRYYRTDPPSYGAHYFFSRGWQIFEWHSSNKKLNYGKA